MRRSAVHDPLARSDGAELCLFDPPPRPLVYGGTPPARATDTSLAAAGRMKPKAASVRVRLLAWIRERGELGGTAEEAGDHWAGLNGLPADTPACRLTAAARMTELKVAAFLIDSGRRRKTRSGCSAAVLVATAKEGDGSICERPS